MFAFVRKHKKHKHGKNSDHEKSKDESIADIDVAPPSEAKPLQNNSKTVSMNGKSHKDEIITLDDFSSDSDVQVRERGDSDSEINVEVLENEMNLEDLMKQKVRYPRSLYSCTKSSNLPSVIF